MTAKLDPALCRTLIEQVRAFGDFSCGPGCSGRREECPTRIAGDWAVDHLAGLADQLEAALEELSHATAHEGDWLSKASRAMCETALGDRDALRAKLRDLEKLVDELRCGDLVPFFDDELPPERAEAFRIHLAACATCQRDLEGHMQLDARLSALAESREPTTRSER